MYKRQGVSIDVLERLASDSPLGAVLAAGLRNHQSSRYVMKEAIEEAGRGASHQLERFLTTLGTIAAVALYNTAFGIAIAVPALIFYRHYRNKVDTYVVEMEQQASKLVDIVHGERVDFGGERR